MDKQKHMMMSFSPSSVIKHDIVRSWDKENSNEVKGVILRGVILPIELIFLPYSELSQ